MENINIHKFGIQNNKRTFTHTTSTILNDDDGDDDDYDETHLEAYTKIRWHNVT